jgi:hypothetical protein
MTTPLFPALLAHLIGETWHVADLLLYGGATLGLVLGAGLFLWGRAERVTDTEGLAAADHEPLVPHSSHR